MLEHYIKLLSVTNVYRSFLPRVILAPVFANLHNGLSTQLKHFDKSNRIKNDLPNQGTGSKYKNVRMLAMNI